MNARAAVVPIVGAFVGLLGLLWLVQGVGLVEMRPILCVANCEPITGGSVTWAVVGSITLVVGAAIVWVGLRRGRG